MQAQQLELDSGLPSPSQSMVSQSLKTTLQTMRMGMCEADEHLEIASIFAPLHARNCKSLKIETLTIGGLCLV